MADYIPVERIPRFNLELSSQTWRRDLGVAVSIFVFGLIMTGRAMSGSVASSDTQHPQVAGASVVEAATVMPSPSMSDISATLQRQLDNALQQSNLQYSLKVVSLSTGRVFGRNEHQIMVGASTTKLISAAAALAKVDTGSLSLNQQVDGRSLQEQLRLMVNQSDNSAWVAINNLVGKPDLQTYARQHGLMDFQVQDNQISAADLAQLLVELHQDTLLSPHSTQLLLSWMNNTNEERLFPASAPGMEVFHKYGWVDGYVHDAAIINAANRATVIVLLTYSDQTTDLALRAPVFGQTGRAIMAAVEQGW